MKVNKATSLCPQDICGLQRGSVISVNSVWLRVGKWHVVIMMDFSFKKLWGSLRVGVRGPKPSSEVLCFQHGLRPSQGFSWGAQGVQKYRTNGQQVSSDEIKTPAPGVAARARAGKPGRRLRPRDSSPGALGCRGEGRPRAASPGPPLSPQTCWRTCQRVASA